MISKAELRIGNWILFSPSGRATNKPRPVSVKMLLDTSCLVLDGGVDLQLFYESAGAQPIPLTAEVLEKCGFERHQNSNEYWSHWRHSENAWGVSQWLLDKKVAGFEEKGVCYWSDQFIPVKTVHHLQNLFHALYQEELTIKL